MKNIFKRTLSIILILCMITCNLPLFASVSYAGANGEVADGGKYSPYVEYQGALAAGESSL